MPSDDKSNGASKSKLSTLAEQFTAPIFSHVVGTSWYGSNGVLVVRLSVTLSSTEGVTIRFALFPIARSPRLPWQNHAITPQLEKRNYPY